MAKYTKKIETPSRKDRPSLSPEARESQMISLAVDLAEQQLRDGTASSQVITHFLKLGTSRADLEKRKIEAEIEEKKAKVKAIESAEEIKVLYENAIAAMRDYSGTAMATNGDDEDYDDYY